MAFDNKGKWFLAAWIGIGIGLAVFGVVLFSLYGMKLGPISKDHTAWSSFGSLLSGFFMVASTGATLATLLFLAHQNRQIQKTNEEQQKVTQAQLAAVNFEQYVNHRRFFMDRLRELQSAFGNKFVFEDGENLYNKVFPRNSPTNLEFTAEVNSSVDTQNFLGKLSSQLNRLNDFSKNPDWENHGARKLIGLLIDVHSTLNIRMTNEVFDGDVLFDLKITPINIYSVEEFIDIAKTIFNSFLFYTGNQRFTGLDLPMGRSASDSLMQFFLEDKTDPSVIKILKIIPGLEIMERIYFNLCEMEHVHFQFLQPSYATLMNAFSSREGVIKLRDKMLVEDLINVGCLAASKALTHSEEGDEGYDLLKKTHEYFNILLTRTQ